MPAGFPYFIQRSIIGRESGFLYKGITGIYPIQIFNHQRFPCSLHIQLNIAVGTYTERTKTPAGLPVWIKNIIQSFDGFVVDFVPVAFLSVLIKQCFRISQFYTCIFTMTQFYNRICNRFKRLIQQYTYFGMSRNG